MYEKEFSERLTILREQKGVSAREMSLGLGQNPGYINSIESGKALPSMNAFFFICEYLDISPRDFFDFDYKAPKQTERLVKYSKHLNEAQLSSLTNFIKTVVKK